MLAAGAAVAVAFHVAGGGGHLVAVGPTNSEHGFPVWYEDGNGLTLDLCVDPADPMCLAAPLPNPDQPIAFPGNFPDESSWFNAGAQMDTNGGGQARLVLGLEAAFAGGAPAAGDQISFGRIRYVIDNLQAGATYTITSPYGTDELVAPNEGPRSIVFTEDIGIAPGDFTGALNSRIGPFLTWDPAVGDTPPAGDIGDPAAPHRVVGSPFGTNVFRIVGPGVGEPGSPFLCAAPPGAATDCIETDLFTVSGKISTVAGVDGARDLLDEPGWRNHDRRLRPVQAAPGHPGFGRRLRPDRPARRRGLVFRAGRPGWGPDAHHGHAHQHGRRRAVGQAGAPE